MFSDWLWVQNVVFPLVGMGMVTLFGVLILRTVNKAIDRRGAGRVAKAEIEEMKTVIEEMREELRGEITELHERVDFTERALTSGRSARAEPCDRPPRVAG